VAERHTVIVGGGVIGICSAYYLARRGGRVTVLERGSLGEAASYGNAGSIAPGHLPINKPGRMWQAIKWMFNPTSPLHIARPFDPGLWLWLLEFQRHCTHEHLRRAMNLYGPLGHATQALFDELIAEEKLACDYRRQGYYEVFLTERGVAGSRNEVGLVREQGYAVEELSGAAMREREPAFRAEIRGAVHHPEASTANPHHFVLELARAAQGHGAEIRTRAEVAAVVENGERRASGVRLRSGEVIEADVVLLATGAYSQELLRRLGYRMPLQPAKGYHRDSDPKVGGAPALGVPCILGESFVFCTPMDDFVRFAGTLEFSGLNHEIRRARLDELTTAARRYFEHVGDTGTRSEWCGLRPCLADGLPAVGWVPRHHGLFVANGHAMMGLTLGPITGKIASDLILDGRTSLDVSAMSPERF